MGIAITALSHGSMLRTRTSILSGVTIPQACNRASHNLATVVGGLSISLIISPIWSQIYSMGFTSRFRTDHCMTPTSSLLENCVYFVQYGVWHCHIQIQNSFGKLPWPREGYFGARSQCSVAGWPCHPTPPAPLCLIHGKHPMPWGRGRHFHPVLGCNSPLVSHQHADELGHNHHSGKGWTWTHLQISYETSADGSSSGAYVPIRWVSGDDHESVWGIWLDILSDTKLLLNVFGPSGQKRDVQFAWSVLPWISMMRETFSLHDSNKGTVFPWSSSADAHMAFG